MGFTSVPNMQDRPFGAPLDLAPTLRSAIPMTEDAVQRAVVQHLRSRGVPGLVWFHVGNNPRSPRDGARLKAMGAKAGVADLILLHRGEAFALELKAKGGRASMAQDQFLAQFRQAGGYAFTAEGLDNALIILKYWGLFSDGPA